MTYPTLSNSQSTNFLKNSILEFYIETRIRTVSETYNLIVVDLPNIYLNFVIYVQ